MSKTMTEPASIDIDAVVSSVHRWDDWQRIERDVFGSSDWPANDAVPNDRELTVAGVKWRASHSPHKASRELEFLLWKARDLVFNKLEPAAATENANHPERYGKLCVICSLWTRQHEVASCSICGHETVSNPLNED